VSWQSVFSIFAPFLLLALSVVSVVFSLEEKTNLHHSLSDRFRALKARIRIAESEQMRPNEETWVRQEVAKWRADKEEIESDEPQIFCALQDDVWCATATSMGRPIGAQDKPKGLRYLLRHYVVFENTPSMSSV
jgi:hypothetical protein